MLELFSCIIFQYVLRLQLWNKNGFLLLHMLILWYIQITMRSTLLHTHAYRGFRLMFELSLSYVRMDIYNLWMYHLIRLWIKITYKDDHILTKNNIQGVPLQHASISISYIICALMIWRLLLDHRVSKPKHACITIIIE